MAGVPHAAPEPVMIRLVDSSVTAARRERGASGAVERAGQRWPVTGDGTPLSFIAQISTGDISAPGGRLPLPAGFLLAFFYEAVGQEAWGNDPKPPPDQPMRRRPSGLQGGPHRLVSEVTENARRAARTGCRGRRATPHRPRAALVVARPAATDRIRDPQQLATLTPNSGAHAAPPDRRGWCVLDGVGCMDSRLGNLGADAVAPHCHGPRRQPPGATVLCYRPDAIGQGVFVWTGREP